MKFLLLLLFLALSDSTQITNKMYRQVSHFNYCFRRFNATHQIGCSSIRSGNVGVLHYVNDSSSLSWLIDVGPHGPYVVIVTSKMFNRTVVDQLRASGKIGGIMVMHKADDPDSFPDHHSSDDQCPNSAFDLYGGSSQSCKNPVWNPYGNSLMFEDFEFPIVAMTNSTEVDTLLTDCYERFNKPPSADGVPSYPLCAVRLKDAMDGAKDTPTCMRRSSLANNLSPQTYCEPLGSDNVFAFYPQMMTDAPYPANSVVLLAARLDSLALFEHLYPAADGAVAGFVTLLAVVKALSQVKDQLRNASHPLLFTFFNGESFDYIGSQRLLYEMAAGRFPTHYNPAWGPGLQTVNISHIGYFLELSQVALAHNQQLFMHSDPISLADSTISNTVATMKQLLRRYGSASGLQIGDAPAGQRLPPASAHTFLRQKNISTILLADHSGSYANHYYHSHLDLPDTIGHTYPNGKEDKYSHVTPAADLISRIATAVARAAYNVSMGVAPADADVQVDNRTVTNLLYCFLVNASCELLETVSKPGITTGVQVNDLYVGVYRSRTNRVREFVQNLLAYYLGTKMNLTSDTCNNNQVNPNKPENPYGVYIWMQGPLPNATNSTERVGLCMLSSANRSKAESPAFDISDYDWSSNQYSSWTESIWAGDAQRMDYFLVPSTKYEITLLVVGLLLTALSFVICWYVRRQAHLLFPSQPVAVPTDATVQ